VTVHAVRLRLHMCTSATRALFTRRRLQNRKACCAHIIRLACHTSRCRVYQPAGEAITIGMARLAAGRRKLWRDAEASQHAIARCIWRYLPQAPAAS